MYDLATSIIMITFSIGFCLAMLIVFGALGLGFYCSSLYEKEYKISLINLVKSNPQKKDTELADAIYTSYQYYRNRRINAFSYYDLYSINSRLIEDLRSERYKKYYSEKIKNSDIATKIERVTKYIQEKDVYSNEKLNTILQEMSNSFGNKETDAVRQRIVNLFEACIIWCDGRLFEKDITIQNLSDEKKKAKISKFVSRIIATVGLVGSIITIVAWIQKFL